MCFLSFAARQAKFVRATDAAGTAWSDPVRLNFTLIDELELPYALVAMEIVEGNPAVCLATKSLVEYCRAIDANGTAWGAPVRLRTNAPPRSVRGLDMKVVQGRPAVIYNSGGSILYQRAMDAAGTEWGNVSYAGQGQGGNFDIRNAYLQIIQGRPVVGCFSGAGLELILLRASDPAGAAWEPPLVIHRLTGTTGMDACFAVVNGKPAMIWHELAPGLGLRYMEAPDGEGATVGAWSLPVTVSAPAYPGPAALLDVSGQPAVVCIPGPSTKDVDIEFIRAPGDSGAPTHWPLPLMLIEAGGSGSRVYDGETKDLGVIRVGAAKTFPLVLVNSVMEGAAISELTAAFEGPDASEFSFVSELADRLDPGSAAPFEIRHAPVVSGLKSAVLRFRAVIAGAPSDLFHVILAVNSAPDISLEFPTGASVVDDGLAKLPITRAGDATDHLFTVRNPGGSVLNGLTVTIDGPDALEFFVIRHPDPNVSPLGSTAFILRHAPVTTGRKTASLHISSNAAGDKNHFDVSLRTLPGTPDTSFHLFDPAAATGIAVRAGGTF